MRYFFIKYRIKTGDMELKHCPMTKKSADHFTKSLQEELFWKFREQFTNILEDTKMAEMGWDGTKEKKAFPGS